MKQAELRSSITDKIISSLESNVVPWIRPWRNDPNCGSPTSVSTKKQYQGINILLLNLASLAHGFDGKWWGTMNQWNKLGGSIAIAKRPTTVEAGHWGTPIVLYKIYDKEVVAADGSVGVKKNFFMTSWTVFNIDQVNGKELDMFRPNKGTDDYLVRNLADCSVANKIIQDLGADIRYGGNRACYVRPKPDYPNHTEGDYIQSPPKSHYTDVFAFYDTMFHEMAHWCEARLGWTGAYAEGELIAEMAACFLSNECNIPHSEDLTNHTAYLKTWLKAMKEDSNFIFKAAKQASKVVDYILKTSNVKTQELAGVTDED